MLVDDGEGGRILKEAERSRGGWAFIDQSLLVRTPRLRLTQRLETEIANGTGIKDYLGT